MSKVILITGGSSGIGKSIGEYLLERNYTVIGTSRKPRNYTDSKFPLVALDVTKPQTISTCIAKVLEKTATIDILINNAGVGITGPLEEIPQEEIQRNFETNFFGPIHVIKAVLPHMRTKESGLIINITSIAGYMGLPYRSVYSASKGALELITEAFRMELKPFNIQMTSVAPGDFATNIASGRYHAPVLEDSPYRDIYKQSLETMDAHVDDGGNPLEVAKMIHKIINIDNPKAHYKVGAFMQKVSIALKRILPSKMYERLLMNHYDL